MDSTQAGMPHAPAVRRLRLGRPVPLRHTVGGLQRGAGDPTFRWLGDGARGGAGADGFVRACHTPEGPATLEVRLVVDAPAGETAVTARAWGPGAEWALESVPGLLGEQDRLDDFDPSPDELVTRAAREHAHVRIGRTGLVLDALVPTVIEQKVTGQEAFGGYRVLVRRFGTRAPGPWGESVDGERPLMLPPSVDQWLAIPSWEWLAASVDGARSQTIMRALRVAGRLQECADLPLPQAHSRLRAVPGIGEWTAAEVAQRALGDPDAWSRGDFHVAKNLGWALLGREVDDDEADELLEPYRGHRYRVQLLVHLSAGFRPRRGARMAPRTHLPTRARRATPHR